MSMAQWLNLKLKTQVQDILSGFKRNTKIQFDYDQTMRVNNSCFNEIECCQTHKIPLMIFNPQIAKTCVCPKAVNPLLLILIKQ